MKFKIHLRLAATFLVATFFSLFAASLKASEVSYAVGDTIDLSLPDGQPSLALTITSESQGFGGMRVYSARIGNGPVASSVLVSGDEIYIEARDLDAGVLHKVVVRNGETTVESIDLSKAGRGECIEVETPVESSSSTGVRTRLMASNPFDDVVVAPAPVTIDMMLVFENGAWDWIATQTAYGGSITNFAVMQIAKMNQVLENTGLHTNFWFRLVDIMTVDAKVTTINSDSTTTLKNGADSGEGPYGEVKTRRDACGADCVSLIVDTGKNYGTTGIGYTTKGTNAEGWATRFREWCYSVCAVRSVADSYTLSHEVGHNMGLTHSRTLNGWSKSTFEYANGYNFTNKSGKKYHTIMAYDHDNPPDGTGATVGGYTETPYYSSPDYTLEDGTPVGSNETANATLALRKTCSYIARWRDTKIPMPSDVLFSVAPTDAFIQPLEVALSNVGGFPMHYTLDGSEPTLESPLYSGPLTLTTATTVKAVAVVDENNTTGAVYTASYSPAVEAASYLKLATSSGSWKNGDWRDESGNSYSGNMFFNTGDKVAFLMPGCDIEVDTAVNLGTLVLAGETPFRVTTSRSLAASTLDVVGAATLSGLSYAFANWKLHPGSSLVLSPGTGQTLTYTNNISLSDATASFVVSNGTVSVSTAGSDYGCFGDATLRIAAGGTLVIGGNGWKTGYQNSSPFVIDSCATMRVDSVESIHRPLTLAGGTIDINCQGSSGRAVDFKGLAIAVTENSEVKATNANGYIAIRDSDVSIDVSPEKQLLISAGIVDGGNGLQSNGRGIVKKGNGTLRFTCEPKHSGATTVNAGTVVVGFSSASTSGTGWSVASNSILKVETGCSLSIPSLSLTNGAMLAVSAAVSAPLCATNEVNLSGVSLLLDGANDLSQGKAYPIVSSSGGFAGVSSIVTDDLPELAVGNVWEPEVEGETLYVKVAERVLDIPMGETVNLSDVPSTVVSITGEGTLICDAVLPDVGYGFTNGTWRGIVEFRNFNNETVTQNFQFELYGNAKSRIRLENCKIQYLKNNNATFDGTLVLEQDDDGHAAFTTGNGYSEKYNVFGALEGEGAMAFATGQRQGYVFGTATNYSGSISVDAKNNSGIVGGRYIVFGTVESAGDLPADSNSATITVKSGAVASIGGGATWHAYHGVEIAGTLLVKGAGATLSCDTSAAMGLKLDDGATLRFETADASLVFAKEPKFANGTVNIAFASGVAPSKGKVLVTWPEGTAPAGDFAFADSALATRWVLSKMATGLVVENAPLPATVSTTIELRYHDGSQYIDGNFDFDLPTAWITNYYPTLETVKAVAAKYGEDAANGAKVWQCYMLGLDPTDAASNISLAMNVVGDEIRFAVEGLGETHALDGIEVQWRMKTSTNLVADAAFSNVREYKTGLSPAFGTHSIPDTPADPKADSHTKPADTLFYKITVTFVAEDEEIVEIE